MHVFEEDTPEGDVYRPESDDIPLSRRPRRRLVLAPDGTARVLLPGPDDRLVEAKGTWEEKDGELVIRTEGGPDARAGKTLRVTEWSPKRLVVRK